MEEHQFLGFGGCGASSQRAQGFGKVTVTKKSSKKNTPGAMVSNNHLNKECSQLSGKLTLARKMAREAMEKNTQRGNLQYTQESRKAILTKQRVGGALKNNAPGGRTLKNRAAKVPKKHSIKLSSRPEGHARRWEKM